MVAGAFSGWFTVYSGGGLVAGVLVALAVGAVLGLVHGMLTVAAGLSQHVAGIGLTLLSTSLSYFLYRMFLPTPDLAAADHPLPDDGDSGVGANSADRPGLLRPDTAHLSRLRNRAAAALSAVPDASGPGGCGWSARTRRRSRLKASTSPGCGSARWSSAQR